MQIKTIPQFEVNHACFHGGKAAASFGRKRNKKKENGASTVAMECLPLHNAEAIIYFASGFIASST